MHELLKGMTAKQVRVKFHLRIHFRHAFLTLSSGINIQAVSLPLRCVVFGIVTVGKGKIYTQLTFNRET